MTMGHKDDTSKMKGVDREECAIAEGRLDEIQNELSPHGIKVTKAPFSQSTSWHKCAFKFLYFSY